jgi:hypothetical protein
VTDSITPPSDQLKKWEDKWFDEEEHPDVLLIQAFQAGADQELEACCEWVKSYVHTECGDSLRIARRPKPPSLKEEALKGFDTIAGIVLDEYSGTTFYEKYKKVADTIRRALEALPND